MTVNFTVKFHSGLSVLVSDAEFSFLQIPTTIFGIATTPNMVQQYVHWWLWYFLKTAYIIIVYPHYVARKGAVLIPRQSGTITQMVALPQWLISQTLTPNLVVTYSSLRKPVQHIINDLLPMLDNDPPLSQTWRDKVFLAHKHCPNLKQLLTIIHFLTWRLIRNMYFMSYKYLADQSVWLFIWTFPA